MCVCPTQPEAALLYGTEKIFPKTSEANITNTLPAAPMLRVKMGYTTPTLTQSLELSRCL